MTGTEDGAGVNKSESRYFNTAARMDDAFLRLLEKKSFEFITVKEICAEAGVNRSTFYLHYETIADLLSESVERMNEQFRAYMQRDSKAFIEGIRDRPTRELYLITPEYLKPYLNYVRENRRLLRTALENAAALQLEKSYAGMFQYVIAPILDRFGVPENDRGYLMAFYMNGLVAIVGEWLKNDCRDSVDHLVSVICRCVVRID